jgi:DNA-binding response OmpR family regulator
MKAHILIVEDESVLYDRLKVKLEKEHYSVDAYTPSVKEALARINLKRPDVVLLDIDLKGEHTGLDLGKMLNSEYHIPFIYVTEYDDDQTFYEGLETKHEHFMVKTKPRLDMKVLLRTIKTVLKKYEKCPEPLFKDSLMAYVGYINGLKELGAYEVAQVPVKFDDILFFTTNELDYDNPEIIKEKVKLKPNYARLKVKDGSSYYLPLNLSSLCKSLPPNFIRISEDYIINLNHEDFQGRINGRRIQLGEQVFNISNRFKAEFEKRVKSYYQNIEG